MLRKVLSIAVTAVLAFSAAAFSPATSKNESSAVIAASAANSFSTAEKINSGTFKSDALLKKDSVNYYYFNASSNGYFHIEFSKEYDESYSPEYSWARGWKVKVYNENIELLREVQFSAGNTKTDVDHNIGIPSGKYYITVEQNNVNKITTVGYKIKTVFKSSNVWETEINDSFSTADSIKLSTTYYGSLVEKSHFDDYYKISVPTTGYYYLTFGKEYDEAYSPEYSWARGWKITVYDPNYEEVQTELSAAGNTTKDRFKIKLYNGANYLIITQNNTDKITCVNYNFSVVDNQLSSCKATIPYSSYTYRGRGIKPSVTVKDGAGKKLTKDKDYTVSYSNNTNVGTATITIKGKGSYTGTLTKKFTVKPLELTSSYAKVTIPYSSYTYTGSAIKPAVTVKFKDGDVIPTGQYTVSYSANKNVGTAAITVKGNGKNTTGTFKKTFVVKPAKNAIKTITSTKGAFKITWNKGTAGTVGYQVQYSTDKNFSKNVHSWTTTTLSKTSENFSSVPKSGETWYVKVRSFYTKDGKSNSTRYGNYSAVKTVKIK